MNLCALIPSYNPDERLISTVDDMHQAGFRHIIVVDDGSCPVCQRYFDALPRDICEVLHLSHNMGKGEALKQGFLSFLTQEWTDIGVVTIDGDGQHSARDAMRCAHAMEQHPNALILGGRDFTGEQVPAKSKSGNRIMTFALNRLCGIPIRDTQTGLRAIPRNCLLSFVEIAGSRYEYETNMLLYCKQHHIPMVELPISTIYIDDNAGSHYRPVRDSLRIGWMLLRRLLTSAAAPLAGLAAFALLALDIENTSPAPAAIGVCAAVAALISGLVGFDLHQTDLSQTQVDHREEVLRYIAVAVLQCTMTVVWLGFLNAAFPAFSLLPAKMMIDCLMYPLFGYLEHKVVFSRAAA